IDVLPDEDPGHIDFIALAAHKMYAPFGTGALVGPTSFFAEGCPDCVGGGTVKTVSLDAVDWADPPDRDEAGSPNVVGAVAMATAARVLMSEGMERVAAHEQELIEYALGELSSVPGLRLYGESDPGRASERVGVIPFALEGLDHALVAAIAGYEGGIGVRNGCFCAHPYVTCLLGLSQGESERWRSSVAAGDRSSLPGLVRMSLGCYSETRDIDRLVEMLHRIVEGNYSGRYAKSSGTGEYYPDGYRERFQEFFQGNLFEDQG
ncbi:aminotransferase class V-fold PLP-dependent enzyme, partial [Candidatus Fermentibacterales bacterium]|nr:aminotransferase class V-fold PLP-dependent enzyme [Candidatus Fermentibacterales bacterium]